MSTTLDTRAAGLRADVAAANRICHRAGLVDVYGHVSARIPGTDTFLIPTRSSPALVRPETLLVMDCDGNPLAGEGTPNAEFWIHARIYAARPDVGAVAHVHSPACVAVTSVQPTVRALHNVAALVADCPLYRPLGLISTRTAGDEAAAALAAHPALLLRGHGANVVGSDVRVATMLACFLDESARRNLAALSAAGGHAEDVAWYSPSEVQAVAGSMASAVDPQSPRDPLSWYTGRFWEYHCERIGTS